MSVDIPALVRVLREYAIDGARSILPAVTEKAVQALGRLFLLVKDRYFKSRGKSLPTSEEAKNDPTTFAALLGAFVAEECATDPQFRSQLISLLAEYNSQLGGAPEAEKYRVPSASLSGNVGSVIGSGTLSVGGDIVGRDKQGGS